MKGLIRKDMYCLRKILKIFFIVTLGVILLSVLLIFSTRCGNIARAVQEMEAEKEITVESFYAFFRIPVWLTLFIPLSFLSMVVECFKEDRKAEFAKVMLSMPLSEGKIVGSRYLSCLLFALLGLAGSTVAAFFVSRTSEIFQLPELMDYIFCFGGCLLIYMSFVMFMIYLLGVDKADLIQCLPFLILLFVAMVAFQRQISVLAEAEIDAFVSNTIHYFSDFMKEQSGLIFLLALGCMALSFLGSCMVLKRRKGRI